MPSFPIARRLLRFAAKARAGWRLRHQHPASFALHMLGIPLALVGLGLFALVPWPVALGVFVGGYVLQWLGHRIEGNDVGEFIPLKKLLGLKTVAIAPQFQARGEPPASAGGV